MRKTRFWHWFSSIMRSLRKYYIPRPVFAFLHHKVHEKWIFSIRKWTFSLMVTIHTETGRAELIAIILRVLLWGVTFFNFVVESCRQIETVVIYNYFISTYIHSLYVNDRG